MPALSFAGFQTFIRHGCCLGNDTRKWRASCEPMRVVHFSMMKPESWRTNALFMPEPRRAYKSLLKQGWLDAIRNLYPDQPIYIFWDYFYNAYERNAGLRLDHLLLSPQLASRLSDAGVDKQVRGWEKTSDHAPVWIKLKS